jgi:hypothetical protein
MARFLRHFPDGQMQRRAQTKTPQGHSAAGVKWKKF